MQETTIPTIHELLEASAATEEFKAALRQYESSQQPNPHVAFLRPAPTVKALRAICGLLEQYPELPVSKVEISATSGCSDFRGELVVNGEQRFAFVWDCAWKARQMGWTDYFGEPDQIRAAKTFGYRCFEKFEAVN